MEEYLRLSPYPDAHPALDLLKGRKLAILSNGSPAMLDAVVSNAGLGADLPQRSECPYLAYFQAAPKRLSMGRGGTGRTEGTRRLCLVELLGHLRRNLFRLSNLLDQSQRGAAG